MPVLCLQVREDVTRYRYGDEQHLDEALNKVFMFNRVSLCHVQQWYKPWLGPALAQPGTWHRVWLFACTCLPLHLCAGLPIASPAPVLSCKRVPTACRHKGLHGGSLLFWLGSEKRLSTTTMPW